MLPPVPPLLPGHGHASCRHDTSGATREATAFCRDCVEAKRKSRETVTTISHPCGNRSRRRRKTSRIIRLILLRRTDPRTTLWTLIPSRLPDRRPVAMMIRVKPGPFRRLPFRYTCINSHDFLSLSCFGSPNRFTDSNGQALPSLRPSAPDDGLTLAGAHPLPEAMGALASRIAWLKRSFAHCSLSFLVSSTSGKGKPSTGKDLISPRPGPIGKIRSGPSRAERKHADGTSAAALRVCGPSACHLHFQNFIF